MEPVWLTYAKRLGAIAATGLHYARDPHDRERYSDVAAIAHAMLAQLGDVPIERIESLVPAAAQGYATPKIDVRAAVIEDGRILLVQERADDRWTLPGGFADIGLSASENARKEVWEEAGIAVAPRVLYAIRHKAKRAYEPDARDFYKLFFLCDRVDDRSPRPGGETSAARFFYPDALPLLSEGRTVAGDIAAAFAQAELATPVALFD